MDPLMNSVPTTDAEVEERIPLLASNELAQDCLRNLYRTYRDQGEPVIEAWKRTLQANIAAFERKRAKAMASDA